MPTYEYHAIRAEGDDEKSFVGGVIVAKSRQDAKEKLRERGLKATMLRHTKGVVGLLRVVDVGGDAVVGFLVDHSVDEVGEILDGAHLDLAELVEHSFLSAAQRERGR